MNEIGGMEWMEEMRVRLIICKAYSGVSSEAMGPNEGSIWLCNSRVHTNLGRGTRRQMTEVSRSPTKWKARGLSSERGKHHNQIALSFGCTVVLCSDLLKVKCQVANYNVAFQEWTERRPRQHYTPCGDRLLYWWKRMHVFRLALHVLVVTGEQGSAT